MSRRLLPARLREAPLTAPKPPMSFGNLVPANLNWTDWDRRVADALSSYWANFAAKGDPNGKGLPAWPAMGKSGNRRMVLGDKIEVEPEMDKARLDFFESYYSSLLSPHSLIREKRGQAT